MNCRRCGNKKRPVVEGKRVCAPCLDYEREYNQSQAKKKANKRYWESTGRDLKRERLGITPIEELREQQAEVRRQRCEELVWFAEEHGRLPTITEIRDMFPCNPVRLRRQAFGLRYELPSGPKTIIPYPVPEKYLAER